jgi:voltage-gated potassium channel Kch
VIDHNPRAIIQLQEKGYDALFGDAGEREFLAEIPLDKAKIIISTISDLHANLTIQEHLKAIKSKASFLVTSEQPYGALDLYKAGVDYVIIPHHLGGDLVASIIKAFKTEQGKYKKLGKDHLMQLLKAKENSTYT